jgi:SOS-response transcriptional repressor LexA
VKTFLDLSAEEYDVWVFMAIHFLNHGSGPTYREIKNECGLYSNELAMQLVQALADKGYMILPEPQPGHNYRPARALRLMVWPQRVVALYAKGNPPKVQ